MIDTRLGIRLYGIAALASLILAAAAPAHAQYHPRPMNNPTSAESYHIEAAADYWFPDATITLSSTSLGIPGSIIDFKNDLGLTNQKFPALQAQLKAGRNKLRFQFIPISYSQTATLPRSVVFNGQLYSIGLPVSSTLDWKAFRFGYEFDIISRDRGFLGIIAEAKYTDVSATLIVAPSGSRPGINEFDQARAPIPALGGIARIYVVPNLALTADITGFKLPDNAIKDASGHYVDVDVYGTLNFTRNVGVKGGYRALDLGYGFKTDSGTFTLKGPYFGLVVRY